MKYLKFLIKIDSLIEQISKISNEISVLQIDKKKVKGQLENEEIYNNLQNELTESIKKHFLYKLAENDIIIEENMKSLMENQDSLKISTKEKEKIVSIIQNSESLIQKFQNDASQFDKKYLDLKKIMQQNKENLMSKEEQIKLREVSLFTFKSQFNQIKQLDNSRTEKLKDLNYKKEKIQKEIDVINNKINAKLPEEILKKTQLFEYNEIKKKVDVDLFTLNTELDKINSSFNEISHQIQITERNKEKLEDEKEKIENEIKNFLRKCENEEETIKTSKNELELFKNSFSQMENDKLKIDTIYEETFKLLNEKTSKLISLESFKQENNQRKKVLDLMRTNLGIKGFLYELIKPIQQKYEIPVKVGLLKYLGYLVVDTNETAKLCSEYFKKKEISQDILVLENIPIKDTKSNIRSELMNLGNLLVDFIDCSKINKLQNALNYFLKDLVLCYDNSNIQKLKNLGFHFIINMEGTLLRKGTILGGTFKNLSQYSFNYKFQSDDFEFIKKEIQEIQAKLKIYDKEREKFDLLNKLKNSIMEKDLMIESSAKTIKINRQQIDKLNNSLIEKIKAIELCLSSLMKFIKSKKEILFEEERIIKEINKIKDKYYSNFIMKNDLKSIKDFELGTISEMKKYSEELKILEEQINKINNEARIIHASEEKMKLLDDTLMIEKEKISQLKSEKGIDEKKYLESKKEFEDYENNLRNGEDKLLEQSIEVSNKKKELNKIYDRIRCLIKNKSEFDHLINTSIQNKNILFEESKLSSNSYPFIQNISKNYSYYINLDLQLNKFIIDRDANNNLIIDYSLIEKKEKVVEMSLGKIKEKSQNILHKCEEKVKDLEKYIKQITLTEEESEKLKEKENEINKRKKTVSTELNAIVSELDEKKCLFEKVKKERKEAFESFFNKLSEKLKQVYNELTKSNNNFEQGGSTYLYNLHPDEPYLGTICYLPTPPGKRVIYDINQLSGGEKTIAIISLIISLQSLCKNPLIILDEIDSYLDREHEIVLENLFKTQKSNFQIIMVTHKSNIFRSSESLIGTYFNKNEFSSIPISIDMRKIDKNDN